jgi:hypothetical protein
MQSMYYFGLDIHKKTVSYCVKDGSGPYACRRRDSRNPIGLIFPHFK